MGMMDWLWIFTTHGGDATDMFAPVRWMERSDDDDGGERGGIDRLQVVRPFSVGPMNGVGEKKANFDVVLVVQRIELTLQMTIFASYN